MSPDTIEMLALGGIGWSVLCWFSGYAFGGSQRGFLAPSRTGEAAGHPMTALTYAPLVDAALGLAALASVVALAAGGAWWQARRG